MRRDRCRGLLALAAAVAVLSACATRQASVPVAPGSAFPTPTSGTVYDVPLPSAVMDAVLVDQSGREVTIASLRGTTVVLADFLTLCQEVCPLTSANLRIVDDAVRKAGLAGSVHVLEVTVDPERDTPTRLASYQKLFGVSPSWSFLTGDAAQVAALWKAVGVGYQRTPEPPGAAPKDWLTGAPLTYDVDHQDVVVVIGPDGHERWLVDATPLVPAASAVPGPLQHFLNDDGLTNETAPPDPAWTPKDVEQAIAYVTGHQVG